MIRIFKHYVPKSLFALGMFETLLLFAAVEIGYRRRIFEIDSTVLPVLDRLPENLTFVMVNYVAMLALGLYQFSCCRSFRVSALRLAVALSFSFIVLSVIFFIYPDVLIWRSILFYSFVLAFILILVARWFFTRVADLDRFKKRVVVLGGGERASRLCDAEQQNYHITDFIRMTPNETAVDRAIERDAIPSLTEFLAERQISEIVLAMQERRGRLPTEALVAAKLRGVGIVDFTTFLERETGRVDLETLSPSWLIFSDGFVSAGTLNGFFKRTFDVVASLTLLMFSLPVLIFTALGIKLTSPGPVFFKQERVGYLGRVFSVYKFRSMRNDAEKDGPQFAQEKDPRVTPIGRLIRSTRIDEIPQIINVLRGDMSFVGPRPERPVFVDQLAAEIPYYRERHMMKPGITGWAQLNYPYGASIEDARHKLEYDLYYVKNYTIFLDLLILVQTVRVIFWQDGVR
ncbi:MAG: TIGR03013 family XrtA/PEP-CTERM system glycosyltransferase [Pseudomonadota bacterium]